MSDWREIYNSVELTPEETEAAIFEGKKKKWFLQRAKENGMICEQCQEWRPVERNGLCASCNAEIRKAERKKDKVVIQLPKISTERKKLEYKYNTTRKKFLKGKKCMAKFPHNCPIDQNLTIHHMSGRVGFADEWARENDIPLLIDDRFFMPLCIEAHQYINDNPKFAWENGYSFKRVTDPIFRKG